MDEHASVDVEGVARDVAGEVRRAVARETDKTGLVRDALGLTSGGLSGFLANRAAGVPWRERQRCANRERQNSQENDTGSDLDRLSGTLERAAVHAGDVLRGKGIASACETRGGDPISVQRTSAEKVECTRGVTIGPGATALTRMSFSASWFAQPRVKETIAPLVAVTERSESERDQR